MTKTKKIKWELIAREYVVSLFPVFKMADAFASGLKPGMKKISFAQKFENHAIEYYYSSKDWQLAHQELVKKIKASPRLLSNLFVMTEKLGKKQITYTKKITNQDLKKTTNTQLYDYYATFNKLNQDIYQHGLILPLLDFQKTTFLSDELNKFLKQKKALKHFTNLTTPLRDTFNRKQENNLLKILIQIKRSPGIYKFFQQSDSPYIVEVLPAKNKKVWQQIKNHTKKYTWVHYVYEGPAAEEAYFIDIIKDFIRRQVESKKELIKRQQEKIKLQTHQQAIIKRLKPDKYSRWIIKLAQDAVFFKMYRRELQTCSYYYISFILQEIAKRLHLSLRQIRMMLPQEVKSALSGGKVDLSQINERMKLLVYVRSGQLKQVLTKQSAREFLKGIKKEVAPKSQKEIKGNTAYPGQAKGKVKVINFPEEMKKMNYGDILVSAATNPNLMPAIRKAAAIVTDEGGLTCHAAIVSREFKIPCVVGTNFVSQVVKDNDVVEVDAARGTVRKL